VSHVDFAHLSLLKLQKTRQTDRQERKTDRGTDAGETFNVQFCTQDLQFQNVCAVVEFDVTLAIRKNTKPLFSL